MTIEARPTNAELRALGQLPAHLTTGQRRAMRDMPTSITELERQIAIERSHWRRNLLELRVIQMRAQGQLKNRKRHAKQYAARMAAERDQDARLRD